LSVAPPVTEGLLDLRFERMSDGRTVLVRRRQRFPLRITAAMHLDPADRGMAFVYVQNPTGAVFAGDRLLTRVEAGAGARLHITTQAATRVPRAASGEAWQRIELKLEEDAYVEYAPDQLIPHAGARLEQELAVSVVPGSAFVGTELVSPGRLARGEIHAFELVRLRSEVLDAAGGELCTDVLQLEPRRRRAACRGLLGRHAYVGSVLAAAPGRDCEALASLLDRAVAAEAGVLAAAGSLPNGAGAYARVLAPSSHAALRALNAGWAAARAQLTGLPLPPRRK
jgi:urease accessory protein